MFNLQKILIVGNATLISVASWASDVGLRSIDSFQPFEVKGVQLLVQSKNMDCWFASALMVLSWKERYSTNSNEACQTIDRQTNALYKADKGIQNTEIVPLAKRLGLVSVPPICPTPNAIREWLNKNGPLWTNGISHIVVVAGIRQNQNGEYELKVYDPWPGIGVGWRTLAGWYAGNNINEFHESSRDTAPNVEAVFLRAP